MKKVTLFFTAVILMIACEKEGRSEKEKRPENLCKIVNADSVPLLVKDAFAAKYPKEFVIKWFNKDNAGFCAFFQNAGIEKLALFLNDGLFVKEETEVQQQGQHEDSTYYGGKGFGIGCECELHEKEK